MSLFGGKKAGESFEQVAAQVGKAVVDAVRDGGEWLARTIELPQRELNKALKLVLHEFFTDSALGVRAAALPDGTPVVVSLPDTHLASIRKAKTGEEVGPKVATPTGWTDLVDVIGEDAAYARVGLWDVLHRRTGELVQVIFAKFDHLRDDPTQATIPAHDLEHSIRGDVNFKALLNAGVLVGFAVVAVRTCDAQLKFIPVDDQLRALWEAGQFAKTLFSA